MADSRRAGRMLRPATWAALLAMAVLLFGKHAERWAHHERHEMAEARRHRTRHLRKQRWKGRAFVSLSDSPRPRGDRLVARASGKGVPFPTSVVEVKEVRALEAVARYEYARLTLDAKLAPEPVNAAFIGPSEELAAATSEQTPFVLLHGFDSSSLEYRRLLPELEADGVSVHLLDILGWGFGDVEGINDFSPAAKRAHLYAFWQQHLKGKPMVLGGASLGGGIAIDFAAAYPEAVERLVLIDPQGFIDGAPEVGPLGPLGIKVLGSWPLRWMANQMAYYDKERYATDDAIRIGRLHVDTEGWETASLNYLNSGGYTLSPLVSKVKVPSLLLWGEQDGILDGSEQVPRFQSELGGPVQLEWVPECGHCPHLEQPKLAADLISAFMKKSVEELAGEKVAA